MVTKGKASDQGPYFIKCFERQAGYLSQEVNADGGGELKPAIKWLEGQDVKLTLSTPYTPQLNGVAERSHGVVLSLARACLLQIKLALIYSSPTVMHKANCRTSWRSLWPVRYPTWTSLTELHRRYNTSDLLAVAPCTNGIPDTSKRWSKDWIRVSSSATLAVVSTRSLWSIQ